MSETVDVKLPANILKASKLVCDRFNVDLDEFIADALKGDLEASITSEFEYFEKPEPVALMVKPKTAVYLEWWYLVASHRTPYSKIDDFLMDCAREYMNRHRYTKDLTDEECAELKTMKDEQGVPELAPFIMQIEDLLRDEND